MNAPAVISERTAIKLTVPQFFLLRGFGAFDRYWKAELLDGQLWGTPADGDEEPESDAVEPIKLTVEQYELLDRAGAFIDHYRTELIGGRVYGMSPQYRPHGFVKDELAYRLRRAIEALGSPLHVATEQSVNLAPHNEPQPDIILTTEPVGPGAIPGASVALLVEVADSTSVFDRTKKALVYAGSGVAEYWIADVNKRVVHRLWSPDGAAYAKRDKVAFGKPLASTTIEELSIDTGTL